MTIATAINATARRNGNGARPENNKPTRSLPVISLFSGCGGLDLALQTPASRPYLPLMPMPPRAARTNGIMLAQGC